MFLFLVLFTNFFSILLKSHVKSQNGGSTVFGLPNKCWPFSNDVVLKIKTEMLDFIHFETTLNFDWPGRTVTKLLQQYRNLQHHRSNIRIISYHP
jgi:hypothetical protein